NTDPPPVTGTSSQSFRTLNRTIRKIFPDVVVAPGLMVAATDSRHYAEIADNIFRFSPVRANSDDLKRFHGTNERLSIDGYADMMGLAVFVLQPVDADIDHGSAWFDPVAAYHFGLADGGIDKVGPGAQSREIARTGMRNRHRRIFIEQQLHQGTADQIGAADH